MNDLVRRRTRMLEAHLSQRGIASPNTLEAFLERAIGVVYRPETELASHYFMATLPQQFDEYIWFDETRAVRPAATTRPSAELPGTHPFGL